MLLDEKPRRLRCSARVCSEKKKEQTGFVRSAKYRNNSFGALTTLRASQACTHEVEGQTGRERIQTYSAQREEAKEMQKRWRPGSALPGGHFCRSLRPKSLHQGTKTIPGSAGAELWLEPKHQPHISAPPVRHFGFHSFPNASQGCLNPSPLSRQGILLVFHSGNPTVSLSLSLHSATPADHFDSQ